MKREQLVWTWKGIPSKQYCPGNWEKYFQGFCLNLNELLRFLKSLWIFFEVTLGETLMMAAPVKMFYIAIDYKN